MSIDWAKRILFDEELLKNLSSSTFSLCIIFFPYENRMAWGNDTGVLFSHTLWWSNDYNKSYSSYTCNPGAWLSLSPYLALSTSVDESVYIFTPPLLKYRSLSWNAPKEKLISDFVRKTVESEKINLNKRKNDLINYLKITELRKIYPDDESIIFANVYDCNCSSLEFNERCVSDSCIDNFQYKLL